MEVAAAIEVKRLSKTVKLVWQQPTEEGAQWNLTSHREKSFEKLTQGNVWMEYMWQELPEGKFGWL